MMLKTLPLALLPLLAGGCAGRIDAYYNADTKIVHRRVPGGLERRVVVDGAHALSRPAVAAFAGQTWAAWSYEYLDRDGEERRGIAVGPLPSGPDDAMRLPQPQAPSVSTPGLAAHAGRLVLAWAAGDELLVAATGDGASWTRPVSTRVGPAAHVALVKHGQRLLAVVPLPFEELEGGTVSLFEINPDLTCGRRRDVIADARLRTGKGVSALSAGDALYVGYCLDDATATVSHARQPDGEWVHEPVAIGGGDAGAVSRLAPALAWSGGRLAAVWTDGDDLWLARRNSAGDWNRARLGDVYAPALGNPAGAAVAAR